MVYQNRLLVLLFLVAVSINGLVSQDRHFSQLYSNPLYLSPGLTGAFQGSYRTSLVYRDQWRSALESPLSTFTLSADLNFKLSKRGGFFGNDRVGAGIQFYSDKKEGFDFNTNYINLFAAYHKSLDPNSNQTLSLGFQGGITQRNINFGNLTFGDQFQDGSGYVLETGETINTNNFAFGDFSLGLNYSIQPDANFGLATGIAMHHAFEPNISFYQDFPDAELTNNTNLLNRKYTFYALAEIASGVNSALLPRLSLLSQGPHFEINAGTNLKFFINDDKSNAFYIGTWGRLTNQLESLGLESVTLFSGISFNEFLIGLSYDINTASIANDFLNKGTFELSLILIGSYDNDGIFCPRF